MKTIQTITSQQSNTNRLDMFLADKLKVNRSKITKLIKSGLITVNQIVISKPGFDIHVNDVIEIMEKDNTDEQYVLLSHKADLDVKYEDDDLIIIYKPSGVLSHSSQYNEQDTIQNIVLWHANNKYVPKLVHRLDKNTSGLMIFAKNDNAQQLLQKMFENRQIIKKYYALVHSIPKHEHLKINVPIARANDNRLKMVAGDGKLSKPALTEVFIKEKYNKSCLLDIILHTGRTHQIRVHLKYINTPIINDHLYGADHEVTDYGQYLMAYHLQFTHPIKNKSIEILIDLDKEFLALIEKLKQY